MFPFVHVQAEEEVVGEVGRGEAMFAITAFQFSPYSIVVGKRFAPSVRHKTQEMEEGLGGRGGSRDYTTPLAFVACDPIENHHPPLMRMTEASRLSTLVEMC